MKKFVYISILILTLNELNASFLNHLCSEIYPKNAKNILLFFIDVHQQWSGMETCTSLNPDKFSNVLLMNYAISLINADFNQSIPKGILGSKLIKILKIKYLNCLRNKNLRYL
jgi:hypothetical protein